MSGDGRAPGPTAGADAITFRYADREASLAGVRLLPGGSDTGGGLSGGGVGSSGGGGSGSSGGGGAGSSGDGGAGLDDAAMDFEPEPGGWVLRLRWPPVQRLEYRLRLRRRDGGAEEVCDPANPLRAPGRFGDATGDTSVVERPGYTEPEWLTAPRVAGGAVDLPVHSRYLGTEVPVRLWSPADAAPDEPLPLLLAHDGPEYAEQASLIGFCAALIEAGRLPRHRVALLGAPHRDEWYLANISYARAIALAVLPALRRAVAVQRAVVGMGAGLGALAMLHVHRRYPALVGGLFLQSGSFVGIRLDQQERQSGPLVRISRFVRDMAVQAEAEQPIPIALSCGTAEENLLNNRQMAAVLARQGHRVQLVETPDADNAVAWRDALDPVLADLLRSAWRAYSR